MKPLRFALPLFLLLVGLFAGCTGVPSEDFSSANYGPFPADYQNLIIQAENASFGSPPSTNYVFSKAIPGVSRGLLASRTFGYIVPVEIIHTAGAEARTPKRMHYFMIAGGQVTEITTQFVAGRAQYTGEMPD